MWRSQTNVCTPGGRLVVGGNAVSYVARSGTSLGGGLASAPLLQVSFCSSFLFHFPLRHYH